MASTTLANSTFLDYCGYGVTPKDSDQIPANVFGIKNEMIWDPTSSDQPKALNVAIVLNRKENPITLLSGNWASRQNELQRLKQDDSLWKKYGADETHYEKIKKALKDHSSGYPLTILDGTDSYINSPESRTIWASFTSPEQFNYWLGQYPYYVSGNDNNTDYDFIYWNGALSVDSSIAQHLSGLWIDQEVAPSGRDMTSGQSIALSQGPQSIGNSAPDKDESNLAPFILADYYKFPLNGVTAPTGAVGLIEPGVGSYTTSSLSPEQFAGLLNQYLQGLYLKYAGQLIDANAQVFVQGLNGQTESEAHGSKGERSIDVGVVSAINPNSLLCLYNGSGNTIKGANSTTFTAAQSAIWDTVNNPSVTSNSFGDPQSLAPGSPFFEAYWQLFVDAALRNQTTVIALGDGGSGNETSNGLANVENNVTQPYNLLVGGTSLSTLVSALGDPTLYTGDQVTSSLVSLALAKDPAELWQLIRSGLSQMPSLLSSSQQNSRNQWLVQSVNWLVETVWNQYTVDGKAINNYSLNNTSSGGVDTTQGTPSYQSQYGLTPISVNPAGTAGRGAPDVAANAGGNTNYELPNANLTGTVSQGGTSAASPFWAALVNQINLIFADQGLPALGYCNDLLYTASVVNPGSFNDVQLGNNVSSYYPADNGSYTIQEGNSVQRVSATGYGYEAGPGYDLTSGLGSPNGTLLARTLTAIAHIQQSEAGPGSMFTISGSGASPTNPINGPLQSLLWQASGPAANAVTLSLNGINTAFNSAASGTYAWTSQLAQQSLQEDFDPALLTLFDGFAQGTSLQTSVAAAASLEVKVGYSKAVTPQIQLSNDYGFTDFVGTTGSVRAARPLSVAATPNDAPKTQAVVRMRQNGGDSQRLFFYSVDSLTGTINGIAPGQNGYEEAVQGRLYTFSDGKQYLQGAGYGNYSQGLLDKVDSGDLIASGLLNVSTGNTFYGFAQANETLNGNKVNHLWNYGLNTFGYEDTFGGGDLDYNDTIFQLDFSSASGNQYLL